MIYKMDNPLEHCQIKFDSNSKGEFEGYASVFNGVDSVNDTILPGAFKNAIGSGKRVSMFINHDSRSIPVGDWIKLKEDKTGLIAKGRIDENHRDGPSALSALRRGAMDGLSIGFMIPKGGAKENDDGIREIKEIDLKEISIVNFPADDAARISVVKSEIIQIKTLPDLEAFLRESGLTRSEATALTSRMKIVIQRDAEKTSHDEMVKQNHINDATDRMVEIINNLGVKK